PPTASALGALGPQLRAEALRQRGDVPVTQPGRVFVRQRPLRGLERDAERDRLLSRWDGLASVDVEDAHLTKLRSRRLAGGVDERGCSHGLVDDEREILAQRRVRDDVLELGDLGRAGGERVEIELERAPNAIEQGRMQLPERA